MEIHAPHQPILSFKEALVHLGIVTIGILIALSLEGLLEWQHHRELVHEATANIRDELRDNDNELTHFLDATNKLRAEEVAALDFLKAAAEHRTPVSGSLTVGFSRADISDASWATAQTTGALGLMNYGQVKQYAQIYELQDEFVRLQGKSIDALVLAMMPFQGNRSPADLSSAELQLARERILDLMSDLQTEEQIGQALHKRYEAGLAAR